MKIKKYIHITFTNGSNPYLKYGMDERSFLKEVKKWNRLYVMRLDDIQGNGYFYTATERG